MNKHKTTKTKHIHLPAVKIPSKVGAWEEVLPFNGSANENLHAQLKKLEDLLDSNTKPH